MWDTQNPYNDKDYKTLFKTFYPSLVHFALRYTENQEAAEDIVQELFIAIWQNKPLFDNKLQLRAYLYRSVQNRCLSYLRDLKTRNRHEGNSATNYQEEEPAIIHAIIREEVYRQLFESVDRLPPQCKKICQLTLEGKKPSEIAFELGLAVETVKKQKKIAFKRLRDNLLLYLYITCSCQE